MCGIAGILDPGRDTPGDELGRQALAMADSLSHRGPDDRGVWVDPNVGLALGHRRLAVVDLTAHGHQPMVSTDGRFVASYNGEVYNAAALRWRLEGEGAAFRGGSDTEVLVAAVQHWGLERALEAIEGMFALALWDTEERRLHLVRDRFGEKPLYVGWVGRRLAFASELKAFRTIPEFRADLDRDAVAAYLRHNCIPAPATVYRGVAKLPPGHLVSIGVDHPVGVPPVPRSYWSAGAALDRARRDPLTGSPTELTDRVEQVLTSAVTDRVVADVPVGAFLSGGIDSSLVVALMQRTGSSPTRTFTIGFADRGFDESSEAAAVAAHLGTDHTELLVTDKEATAVLPRLPEIWDEPFGDVSQIPVLLVSQLARTQVTVSLSGDGGDELFAGYNRHAWLERLWHRAAALPGPVRRSAGTALGGLPPGLVDGAARFTSALPTRWQVRTPSTKVTKLGKVLAASSPEDAYLALASHWDDPGLVLGAGSVAASSTPRAPWPGLSTLTEQLLWMDTTGYLPDDILVKLDRAAMAVSLETRAPFLDRAVFELAWRLPLDAKLRGGVTKWVLRQVLQRYVPDALVDRPKMGFGLPIGPWLRGTLRPWAEELLGERRLSAQGLLDPAPVRRAWQRHLSGRADLGYELWDVLALQSWLDTWQPGLSR